MSESMPACRSSRCRHRGGCRRNPAAPAPAAVVAERPRCFEPRPESSPAPLGRTAD